MARRGLRRERRLSLKAAAAQAERLAEEAELLRWREMVWRLIPPTSRKMLMPFLTVQDTLNLDTAISEKEERDHLEKAYRGLRSPAFGAHVFTEKNNFKGLRWARKRELNLRGLRINYKGEKHRDKVLGIMVMEDEEDFATYYAERSTCNDIVFMTKWGFASSVMTQAARSGFTRIVKALLDRDPSANTDVVLYGAAACGRHDIVKILLASGADVDCVNKDGETPLWRAANNGHTEVVQALTDAGADVNKSDNVGLTPLYRGAFNGATEVVRVLVDAGADVNKSASGITPIGIAGPSYRNHPDVVDLLRQAGANE